MLKKIKYIIKKKLFFYTLDKYKTTMFFTQAKKYNAHLDFCKKKNKNLKIKISNSSKEFIKKGYSCFKTKNSMEIANSILKKIKKDEKNNKNFWDKDGRFSQEDILNKFPELVNLFEKDLKNFFKAIYETNFSIFYGLLYKSTNLGEMPKGSQLWHLDGGPGTCINLMYCISDVTKKNGSMKCLTWEDSKKIIKELYSEYYKLDDQLKNNKINKDIHRISKSKLLKLKISELNNNKINQPESKPGLIYAFRNNCIHSGGYPQKNKSRYVFVFHIYPSTKNINFSQITKLGIQKKSPFPSNPFEI